MSKSRDIGKCKLCGQESKLIKGHVAPRFAVNWLKQTSATGYIRQVVNPNLRKQEIQKVSILCANCERRFSIWEGHFYQKLFIPFHQNGQRSFSYGDWLLPFVTSLSWRIATVGIDNFRKQKTKLAKHIDKALGQWQAFLVGKSEDPGPYEHHLLLLDYIIGARGMDLADEINLYLFRGIDYTIAYDSRSVFTYCLLPGLVFWSCIHPPKQEGWEGTHIFNNGTLGQPQQARLEVGNFLSQRATEVIRPLNQMSDTQSKYITDAILKDPERSLASNTYEALSFDNFLQKRKHASQ